MTYPAIATAIYAALLLIGGIIGYITAQSLPSLIMGIVFALLLGFLAFGMHKGCAISRTGALALTGVLFAFFTYRFYVTSYKFMPPGLMVLLSAALILYLLFAKDYKISE